MPNAVGDILRQLVEAFRFSVPGLEAAKRYGGHAGYRIVPAAVRRCAPTTANWAPIPQKMIQAKIGASPVRCDVVPSARMEARHSQRKIQSAGDGSLMPAEKIAAPSWSARSQP